MSKMYRFRRTEVAHVCPKQSHIKQYEKKKILEQCGRDGAACGAPSNPFQLAIGIIAHGQ